MLGALRLAELVAARVCHDVAGLAGSVSQMLALLEADEEALNTAKDANARMIRQLRVLRLAFTAGEISVSPTDLADMFADRPIGVLFDVPIGTVFLAPTARVLANVLLIAEAGLPQGGTVSVAGTPDALVVQLNGTAARWPDGFAQCLAEPLDTAAMSPRLVQMAIAVLAARGSGLSLSFLMPISAGAPPALLLREP